jgi:hypothetical protein
MSGHEVFDVLRKASKVIRDTLFPFHVSDNRLYRTTVRFLENVDIAARLPVSHLISTILAFHAVTIANCVFPFGSHLNSIGVI